MCCSSFPCLTPPRARFTIRNGPSSTPSCESCESNTKSAVRKRGASLTRRSGFCHWIIGQRLVKMIWLGWPPYKNPTIHYPFLKQTSIDSPTQSLFLDGNKQPRCCSNPHPLPPVKVPRDVWLTDHPSNAAADQSAPWKKSHCVRSQNSEKLEYPLVI